MKTPLSRTILPIITGAALLTVSTVHGTAPACDLPPLELPLFGGASVVSLATPETPVASPNISEIGIRNALDQIVACTNTGDSQLVWAMFSPHWFATTFADPTVHYLPAFEQSLDQQTHSGGAPLELTEIVSIEPLPDGRVAVTATFTSGDTAWTDTLTLVMIDGDWLIDEVRPGTPES